MAKLSVKVLTLTAFGLSLVATAPVLPVLAAGGGGGGGGPADEDIMHPGSRATQSGKPEQQAPAPRSSHRTKKGEKHSFLDDPAFRQGYRAAYDTIYERHDYAAAIDQLHALGHDDYANIANLIGYSYRKLGDYKLSRSDLELLRPLADRAGQPRTGGISFEPHRRDLRQRLRRISLARSRARRAARNGVGVLARTSSA